MIKRTFLSFVALLASFSFSQAQKYDGIVDKVVAVLGNEAILLSDVEMEVYNRMMAGEQVDQKTRCQMFETILVNKLYLMQARVDSLSYNTDYVNMALEQYINQQLATFGGQKGVEERYNKPMYKLREEWQKVYEEMALIQQMQSEITSNVPELTPNDVKQFVAETAEEDLPIVPEQYRLSQIVLYPDREKAGMAAKEKLLDIRERIVNGESFAMLARLYSEDPASAVKGGELGMMPKTAYHPNFSDAAASLKPGQVSQIVETPFGYHIIQMISKDGDMINVRHILIKPEYTYEDMEKAFAKLDSIKTEISNGNITFELAARRFSQDMKSRTNGGQMADAMTGSVTFDKDHLNPRDYNVLKDLKVGEISQPFEGVDDEGLGNVVYKIIRIDNITPSHVVSFSNDYDLLLNYAKNAKAEEALQQFLDNKIATTYIVLDPQFKGCDFKYDGWYKE